VINDAPLIITRAENGGGPQWEPKNDDSFDGPLSMRTALARSKNVPSVRILQAITPAYAQSWLSKFGFEPNRHPANLTMVLGTGSVTPLQMAGAYAVFANGGFQVKPYLIGKIVDARGKVLAETAPVMPAQESNRVIDPRNAFVMDSMLREVIRSGTGNLAAQKLGRADLAGKTGTTSEALDGWFAGYSGNLVAVSWMGFDTPKSLGGREFGATLALPAWIQFMGAARRGKPVTEHKVPEGLTQVEGEWQYQEYATGNGVRTLGMDAAPGILQQIQRSLPDWFTSGG
jgi:penicillin-binding protein 1A